MRNLDFLIFYSQLTLLSSLSKVPKGHYYGVGRPVNMKILGSISGHCGPFLLYPRAK